MTERVSNDLKMQGNDNEIIKLCESYARLKGYPYFGIESFQECYFSRDANLEYDRHGDSHSCVNGIGGTFAMNVYQIIGKCFKGDICSILLTPDTNSDSCCHW